MDGKKRYSQSESPDDHDPPQAKRSKTETVPSTFEETKGKTRLTAINLQIINAMATLIGILFLPKQDNGVYNYNETRLAEKDQNEGKKLHPVPSKVCEIHWVCPGRGSLRLLNPEILMDIAKGGSCVPQFANSNDKYDLQKLNKVFSSLSELANELAAQQLETEDTVFHAEQVHIFLDYDLPPLPPQSSENETDARLILSDSSLRIQTRVETLKKEKDIKSRAWFSILPLLRTEADDDKPWVSFFDSFRLDVAN
jgi:hypothetical protein